MGRRSGPFARLRRLNQIGHLLGFGRFNLRANFLQRSRTLEDEKVEQQIDAAKNGTQNSGFAFCGGFGVHRLINVQTNTGDAGADHG
ncbi:hypothetical protein D3C87_1134620 [compost metagenome]